METKQWSPPASMPKLRHRAFEKDFIYARFYLPEVFPRVNRFVYLDNDIIVNADISELHSEPLTTKSFPIPVPIQAPSDVVLHASRWKNRLMDNRYEQIHSRIRHQPQPVDTGGTAAVGFVYENHTMYMGYLQGHLNLSHPLVRHTVRQHGGTSVFFNAGVFVVDAELWRRQNLTRRAEAIMRMNVEEGLYSPRPADQATFYLLLGRNVSYLHPRWNMRRLPKKTISMLDTSMSTGETLFSCLRLRLRHDEYDRTDEQADEHDVHQHNDDN